MGLLLYFIGREGKTFSRTQAFNVKDSMELVFGRMKNNKIETKLSLFAKLAHKGLKEQETGNRLGLLIPAKFEAFYNSGACDGC
jgi:hypothetical protein